MDDDGGEHGSNGREEDGEWQAEPNIAKEPPDTEFVESTMKSGIENSPV